MNMLLKIPATLALFKGMCMPHCNMYCKRPTVFRHTDLPPAFGPEMMSMRCSRLSLMSSGTTFFPCLASVMRSKGCSASTQSMWGWSCSCGLMASMLMAVSALARIKSISARKVYDSRISGICGRTSSVNSVRMRITSRRSSPSSSRMRLLASTTSAGSMKTVFPVADSSCTIPLMRRFSAGTTGITSRPSRTVGFTSLSTMPSACAERSIEFSVRDMLPVVAASSRRILASAGEALSLIFPNLLMMPSMRRVRVGKDCTSVAKASRLGYLLGSSSSSL